MADPSMFDRIKTTLRLISIPLTVLQCEMFVTFKLYGAAERILKRGADKWPRQRSMFLSHLGSVYERKGDIEKAEAHYKEAIAIDPEPLLYVEVGDFYEKQNKLELAVENYQTALHLGTDFTEKFKDMLRSKINQLKPN